MFLTKIINKQLQINLNLSKKTFRKIEKFFEKSFRKFRKLLQNQLIKKLFENLKIMF